MKARLVEYWNVSFTNCNGRSALKNQPANTYLHNTVDLNCPQGVRRSKAEPKRSMLELAHD
jgi:hypothetical protein